MKWKTFSRAGMASEEQYVTEIIVSHPQVPTPKQRVPHGQASHSCWRLDFAVSRWQWYICLEWPDAVGSLWMGVAFPFLSYPPIFSSEN